MEQVFWMCWIDGTPSPTVRHENIDLAKAEAVRWARLNAPKKVFVLEAHSCVEINDVKWTKTCDMPF